MRRILYISILLLAVLPAALLPAEPEYFCVIEGDTLRAKNSGDIEALLSEQLLRYGDAGHPFAQLVLDSYIKKGNAEYFHYRLSKGETVYIDTVVFGDYSPREISLLSRYIDLPRSGKFHYERVRNMIRDLRANPLIETEQRADIYNNGLRLYTKARQDIRFDAVAAYREENARNGIVGNIRCELINLGGLGRLAEFHWSRPSLDVNAFDISYTEPYIFNTPLSLRGAFSQRYRDSLYVKRDLDLGVIYHIGRRSRFGFSYQDERISTRPAAGDSAFVTTRRSGSDLRFFWTSRAGNIYGHIDMLSGIRLNAGNLLSRSTLDAQLALRGSRWGANFKLLGGYIASRDPVAVYDKFRLGGAAFLPRATRSRSAGRYRRWPAPRPDGPRHSARGNRPRR